MHVNLRFGTSIIRRPIVRIYPQDVGILAETSNNYSPLFAEGEVTLNGSTDRYSVQVLKGAEPESHPSASNIPLLILLNCEGSPIKSDTLEALLCKKNGVISLKLQQKNEGLKQKQNAVSKDITAAVTKKLRELFKNLPLVKIFRIREKRLTVSNLSKGIRLTGRSWNLSV